MPSHSNQLEDITVSLQAETEKAWYVSDGVKSVWLPKSQCEVEELKDGFFTLTAPVWLLKDKGLI